MAERSKERLSGGIRRRISQNLKPEARGSHTEDEAWVATEQILIIRIEGYPELYRECLPAIRNFHFLRWNHRQFRHFENWRDILEQEFFPKYEDNILDSAAPAFAIISQIYSK